MSRRRPLSDEERALWSGFIRSIKPLRTARTKRDTKALTLTAAAPQSPPARLTVRRETIVPAKSPPLTPFDRRSKQRVARGHDAIEARIDLHGMTQNEAHAALARFLRHAQAAGKKIVLIVTGKGSRGADATRERGVLRRQVPLWLSLPEFRPLIVGFEEAHVSHGGEGALYVRLRRIR